eukprot:11203977-Lingulodinium_polyedra.AAC.1
MATVAATLPRQTESPVARAGPVLKKAWLAWEASQTRARPQPVLAKSPTALRKSPIGRLFSVMSAT